MRSHVARSGLEFTMEIKMTLYFWFSCQELRLLARATTLAWKPYFSSQVQRLQSAIHGHGALGLWQSITWWPVLTAQPSCLLHSQEAKIKMEILGYTNLFTGTYAGTETPLRSLYLLKFYHLPITQSWEVKPWAHTWTSQIQTAAFTTHQIKWMVFGYGMIFP